jgi:hypothetical protein
MSSTAPLQPAAAKSLQTASASLLLQRKCACGGRASELTGECEECSKKKMAGAQTKLQVNEPGDIYEQEADRVAERVTGQPAHSDLSSAPPRIQRFSGQSNGQVSAAPPSVNRALASPGRSLEPALRQDMERRFSQDFSRVRVHTGAVAEQSAWDVDAHAYTLGSNIVFGAGQFAPRTSEGRRLIAHELAHVVQQRSAGIQSIQRRPVKDLRWKQSITAARYRGRLMATRIRRHGKLSTEARAKINQELAYFEGAAKDVYVKEVRPALVQTVEIEMPEMQMWKGLPTRPTSLSLLKEDPRQISEEELERPLKEIETAEENRLAAAREAEVEKLKELTKSWPSKYQEFAVSLLRPLLEKTTHIDPRAVSDRIRQPILQEYRRWLEEQDKVLEKVCQAMRGVGGLRGLILKSQAAFQPQLDPCRRWFADEDSHGPSELRDLERLLRIYRGSSLTVSRAGSGSPAESVYWDVFELRKKIDPYLLEQRAEAEAIVGSVAAVAGAGEPALAVGETPKLPTRPAATPLPEPAPPAPAPIPSSVPADIPAPLSPRVSGYGRAIEPPPAPVTTDIPPRVSPRVAGFGRDIEPPPAPVTTDIPSRVSPRVAGFGRDIEPPPPRSPASQEPSTTTQMPPARTIPSSSMGQGEGGNVPRPATGQRRDQPARAMAGKRREGDEPKVEPVKTSGEAEGQAAEKIAEGPEPKPTQETERKATQESEPSKSATPDQPVPLLRDQMTAGMEVDPTKYQVFRGGKDFTLKLGETKLDPAGRVKPTHGPSLDVVSGNVEKFGGAHQIKSIPPELKIIQRGQRLEHCEVVPREPMPVTEFQRLLNQIEFY